MDYIEKSKISETNDWWSKAKVNLIDMLLSKIKSGGKILSIGTGTGEEIRILRNHGKVYATDIEENAIKTIPKGLCEETKVCDATNIEYPDEFFDIVTSFDVFEHIGNDKIAIDEVERVLKPGGYLIFTVPAFQFLYSSHDKVLKHKRRYNKTQLKLLLDRFRIVQLSYWNFFLFMPISLIRLIKKTSNPKLDHDNKIGGTINSILYNILRAENSLIRKNISLPIGLTIYGICKKVR